MAERSVPFRVPSLLALLTGCTVAVLAAALPAQWEVLDSVRAGPMCFDPVRGHLVRVALDGSTWERDDRGWCLRTVANAAPSSPRVLFYDQRYRRVIAVSAVGLSVYDGIRWRVLPMPQSRVVDRAAYDELRQRIVVLTPQAAVADTWELDGETWTHVQTSSGPPTAGSGSSDPMVYDGTTNRIVMLTQTTRIGSAPMQMWSYDGTAWTMTTAATPPFRHVPACAYDPSRRRLVLSGGISVPNPPVSFPILHDLWEWDGSKWVEVAQVSNFQPGTQLAFDGDRLAMFDFDNSAHAWTGVRWQRVGARDRLAFDDVFVDALRVQLVGVSSTATYVWRAGRWATVATPQPGVQRVVLDAGLQPLGIATGAAPGMFVWTGAGWVSASGSTVVPPARSDFGVAYDSVRSRAVMFGGTSGGVYLGDTWEWNGQWQQVSTAIAPTPRARLRMVFDPVLRRSLALGGYAYTNAGEVHYRDTWAYSAAGWQAVSPAAAPFLLPGAVTLGLELYDLMYDSAAGQPVAIQLVAGGEVQYAHDGTAWNLLSWTNAPVQDWPSAVRLRQDPISTELYVAGDQGLYHRAPTIAGAATSGAGCGAELQLLPRTYPHLGDADFGFECGGRPGATAVGVSATPATTPLGGGCTSYLGSLDAVLLGTAGLTGFAELALPIPPNPLLVGLTVRAQAAQLDPGSPIGVALSQLSTIVVGR